MRYWKILAPFAAGAAGLAISLSAPVSADTTGCPATYVSCVQMPANNSTPMMGEEITMGAGSGCVQTPWAVTDPSGAWMAWESCYGHFEFGNGGKNIGGLICVTYVFQYSVACLTPEGTLTLQPTGPDGPTGPVVTLTARDVRFVQCLESHGLAYCRAQP